MSKARFMPMMVSAWASQRASLRMESRVFVRNANVGPGCSWARSDAVQRAGDPEEGGTEEGDGEEPESEEDEELEVLVGEVVSVELLERGSKVGIVSAHVSTRDGRGTSSTRRERRGEKQVCSGKSTCLP